MDVVIYTKTTCPYCVRAKKWFEIHNIAFKEINLENAELLAQFKDKFPDAKTVPQILINDERIGGYTDLIAREQDVLKLAQ